MGQQNSRKPHFKRIFSALFDVRPVDRDGNLDVDRIYKLEPTLDLSNQKKVRVLVGSSATKRKNTAELSRSSIKKRGIQSFKKKQAKGVPEEVTCSGLERDNFLYDDSDLSKQENGFSASDFTLEKSVSEKNDNSFLTRDDILKELAQIEEQDKKIRQKRQEGMPSKTKILTDDYVPNLEPIEAKKVKRKKTKIRASEIRKSAYSKNKKLLFEDIFIPRVESETSSKPRSQKTTQRKAPKTAFEILDNNFFDKPLSQGDQKIRTLTPKKAKPLFVGLWKTCKPKPDFNIKLKNFLARLVTIPKKVSSGFVERLRRLKSKKEFSSLKSADKRHVRSRLFTVSASRKNFFSAIPKFKFSFKENKAVLSFLALVLSFALIVPLGAWLSDGFKVKENILNNTASAYQNLVLAKKSLEETDWQNAQSDFDKARLDFLSANKEIGKIGELALDLFGRLPVISSAASASHLIRAGEDLSGAGKNLSAGISRFSLNNLFAALDPNEIKDNNSKYFLTEEIVRADTYFKKALSNFKRANMELASVKTSDLPEKVREKISFLKKILPEAADILEETTNHSEALLSFLGHKNPKQYLLVFQNNSEMRATGGFFGTYGLWKIDRGVTKKLFVDGVYDADGQLHEKVIPPRPIQKISTAWSMHDANWFADFPTSAEKIAWFYEKTGGPTVDGVIALTPTVIERIMELTGPISMPEYEVVLNGENFVQLMQYEVEEDYDRQLNQPKKILADFTPKFIKALARLSLEDKKKAFELIIQCFDQKHILAYFREPALERLIQEKTWGGRLLSTNKDYLSVVSSNINGFKTDRVIEEEITHRAQISEDGSVVDTLKITRRHKGGGTDYDWWNKVNANYLRVYLPKGSELISVSGQTKEKYHPPIDYQKHDFQVDPLVSSIESNMRIDPQSGTRIYEENGKTVFGNWVYVSPGEEVKVTYKYKLPFKVGLTNSSNSYSLLAQKQAGTLGSGFSHKLEFPEGWRVSWDYPENLRLGSGYLSFKNDLSLDRFMGVAFDP